MMFGEGGGMGRSEGVIHAGKGVNGSRDEQK